jgi:hydroxymethylpyrimidine/phosphomethylpyrimidine kinase
MKKVLVIGGFDPSGGAGLQIDLITLKELGVFPFTVTTAVTIQNSQNVTDVYALPSKIILEQVQAILQDSKIDAIKIGMLGTEKNVLAIADLLRKVKIISVIDPVFQASKAGPESLDLVYPERSRRTQDKLRRGGFPLLSPDAIPAFKKHLLPLATILTPNLIEAQKLVLSPSAKFILSGVEGLRINAVEGSTKFRIRSVSDMKTAAQTLHKLGPKWVLIKSGHLTGGRLTDILYNGKKFFEFTHERVKGKDVRGTGCILSSALAGFLALGHNLPEATELAQQHTFKKIKAASKIGKGRPQAWL